MRADVDTLLHEAGGNPSRPLDAADIWRAGRRRRRVRRTVALAGGAGAAVAVVALFGSFIGPDLSPLTIEAVEPAAPVAPVEPTPVPGAEEPPEAAAVGGEPPAAPDPTQVAEPCTGRDAARMEAFIDVAAPVEGQVVVGPVALVGCASVPEATVRYRVVDATGAVLADGFTTATAGGPDLGEFRTEVDVAGAGPVTLEVFWDSPAGEGERDRTSIALEVR